MDQKTFNIPTNPHSRYKLRLFTQVQFSSFFALFPVPPEPAISGTPRVKGRFIFSHFPMMHIQWVSSGLFYKQ